jgi:hypothetical protein
VSLRTYFVFSLILGVAVHFGMPAHSIHAAESEFKTAAAKPVKVFVMMGQSNMLGFGRVGPAETTGSLEFYVKNKGKYKNLVDDNGAWVTRSDVRYVFVMQNRDAFSVQRNEWLVPKGSFGPELGFGHVIGDAIEEPVLLLKACIGNRSLGWDLLPPGSQQFEHMGKIYAGYKESPSSWDKGTTPKPIGWYAGKQYDDDVGNAKKVLANLKQYMPGQDAQGYEIAGFVWWQGHKDQNAAHAGRYEQNLVQLIKSLRKDFDAPKAKFVLATGCGNPGTESFGKQIAEAQLAVDGGTGKYPDFKGNVRSVDVRKMWPAENESPSKQGYHYYHNAQAYYDVGDALGHAMAELLGVKK